MFYLFLITLIITPIILSNLGVKDSYLIWIFLILGISPILTTFLGGILGYLFKCQVVRTPNIFECSNLKFLEPIVTYLFYSHWLVIFSLPYSFLGIGIILLKILIKRWLVR